MIQQFSVRARADARPEDRAAARDSAERPRKERQRRLEDRPEQPEPVNVHLHVISFRNPNNWFIEVFRYNGIARDRAFGRYTKARCIAERPRR